MKYFLHSTDIWGTPCGICSRGRTHIPSQVKCPKGKESQRCGGRGAVPKVPREVFLMRWALIRAPPPPAPMKKQAVRRPKGRQCPPGGGSGTRQDLQAGVCLVGEDNTEASWARSLYCHHPSPQQLNPLDLTACWSHSLSILPPFPSLYSPYGLVFFITQLGVVTLRVFIITLSHTPSVPFALFSLHSSLVAKTQLFSWLNPTLLLL